MAKRKNDALIQLINSGNYGQIGKCGIAPSPSHFSHAIERYKGDQLSQANTMFFCLGAAAGAEASSNNLSQAIKLLASKPLYAKNVIIAVLQAGATPTPKQFREIFDIVIGGKYPYTHEIPGILNKMAAAGCCSE